MTRVEQAFFDRTQAMGSNGAYTTAEVPYFVFNAGTEEDAVQAVYDEAPSVFNGLALESVEIDERINENTFKVIVQYQESEDSEQASSVSEYDSVFSFDTGGGTLHLTQSRKTVGKYPTDAPDFGGAIGYDGETVNGVDIIQPAANDTETHYFPDSKITTAYKKMLSLATGTVNLKSFRGYDPGEVLFLGAAGSKRSSDALWEVTFKFAISPNRKNFEVGDISVGMKFGWDYLWVRYADKVDDEAKTLVKKPVAVYIERVYQLADFSYLGIGR